MYGGKFLTYINFLYFFLLLPPSLSRVVTREAYPRAPFRKFRIFRKCVFLSLSLELGKCSFLGEKRLFIKLKISHVLHFNFALGRADVNKWEKSQQNGAS